MYKFKSVGDAKKPRVQLMGSGTILREVMAAQEMLQSDWGVGSDLWSVTSFTELRRDGLDCERHSMLNPEDKKAPVPYVTKQLEGTTGPIVVSTDYVRSEEHTSELQSLMRNSYAVFCLKKKNKINTH